jgi:hypothetical protein
MALFGWKTEKMALLYTRRADRRRLATTAAPLLVERKEDTDAPHLAGEAPKAQ